MTDLDTSKIIISPVLSADDDHRLAADALQLLLDGARSVHTRRAYEGDLAAFFAAIGEGKEVTPAATALLLAMDRPRLAVTLQHYIVTMRRARLAETTINRRLAAIRALLKKARQLGSSVPDPADLVSPERVASYRDIESLTLAEVGQMLDAIDQETLGGKRDYSLLLTLIANGLRRGELLATDVRDFDARRGKLRITGKGRGTQTETVSLHTEVIVATQRYLDAREAATGYPPAPSEPLYLSLDRRVKNKAPQEQRLSGRGFWEIVSEYGKAVLGRPTKPHAFRHTAITAGLEESGGDVPLVQEFSRHKDVNTVLIYRDRLRDGQAEVSRLVVERLRAARSK